MTRHDIVPTHLAVTAMRDNGYKNAAYAIAELIDNAIQAGANQVELLCGDKEELRRQRKTTQIDQIAVLDNGSGMSADVLRIALQFGNGTYLDSEKHTGIGRFGMGLPSSSISQCRRVDVWTWQNGLKSAIHSYLDIGEILDGKLHEVPNPQTSQIPDMWREIGQSFGNSGTLVVWSQIDRSLWRRSATIIEKSEHIIGRVYRRFLADGRVSIRLATFDVKLPKETVIDRPARPNDPLYLMPNTSCPGYPPHFEEGEPMFIPWGETNGWEIPWNGDSHTVTVRYSIATNEARRSTATGDPAGNQPHGKHAARNVGVSIVRADRELDLDPSWSNPSEPRDRWWGVEIEFPPALDDLFGVTNNKQSARFFSDLAKVNVADMIREEQSIGSARDQYESDNDLQWFLFEIAQVIQKNISTMSGIVRKQRSSERRLRRFEQDNDNSPVAIATEKTDKRKAEGYEGLSDQQESLSFEEKKADIEQGLLDSGIVETEEEAIVEADNILRRSYKYEIKHAAIGSSPAFFDVQSRGGKIIIVLNTQHPVYSQLVEILEEDVENVDAEELRHRLVRASDALDLLLSAWARHEDEQPTAGGRLDRTREARWDWGRMARDFLQDEE